VCLTIFAPETNEENQYCSQISVDSVSNGMVIPSIPDNQFTLIHYPDPVSDYMNFQYNLTSDCKIDISIYDQLGREVAVIVSKDQPEGNYSIIWQNTSLESGMYYLKLSTEKVSIVNKLMVIEPK
jgi:hypothetical protein